MYLTMSEKITVRQLKELIKSYCGKCNRDCDKCNRYITLIKPGEGEEKVRGCDEHMDMSKTAKE